MVQGEFDLGDIELSMAKCAFLNEPERILIGVFEWAFPRETPPVDWEPVKIN